MPERNDRITGQDQDRDDARELPHDPAEQGQQGDQDMPTMPRERGAGDDDEENLVSQR